MIKAAECAKKMERNGVDEGFVEILKDYIKERIVMGPNADGEDLVAFGESPSQTFRRTFED